MKPTSPRLSSPGQDLKSFLGNVVSGGQKDITITGHSLGGSLASTLALWLSDKRSE